MIEDKEETCLSSIGWGLRNRTELSEQLVKNGWIVDKIYGHGTMHCTRGGEYLHLDLLEDAIAITYKQSVNSQAKGGRILRSGRPAEFLIVSINELLASFGGA
jgi:hypothetical protein